MTASPSALVLRFALIYWPSLAAVVYALHQAGTESGTATNLLVFVMALYLASRHAGVACTAASRSTYLAWSVAGIAGCDVLAQAGFVWHLLRVTGHAELWRSLPFAAATTVLLQAAVAYCVLRRRVGAVRP